MEDRKRKTVVKNPEKAVPVMVWAVTGALFLAVILFAHALPDAKTAEAVEYFNVKRLTRFHAQPPSSAPRVVVVGTSLSMSALFFDEDMARFARENGLPGVDLIRFIKMDSALEDFTPLLDSILEAAPDVVIFEARLFVLTNQRQERRLKKMRFFRQDDDSDDRTKLKQFFGGLVSAKRPSQKKDNPNIPVLEQRLMEALRQRQTQRDLWQFQDAVEERTIIRPFSVPDAYQRFFNALRKKRIPAILLDTPASQYESSLYARALQEEMPVLISRYQETCGLQYLAYPGQLGLDQFKDFRHMNERGRETFSRWFLYEVPRLVEKRK